MIKSLKRIGMASVVFPLLMIGLAPVVVATQPEGPVTIETAVNFSSFPFTGTFEVVEGHDILGCPSGTFVDLRRGSGVIQKIFTCSTGAGSFTYLLRFNASPGGPGDFDGHWVAWMGTGAFDGLHGEGELQLVFTGPLSGVETLTGMIHFEP